MGGRVPRVFATAISVVLWQSLNAAALSRAGQVDEWTENVRNGRGELKTGVIRFWHCGGLVTEPRQYVARFAPNGVLLEYLGDAQGKLSDQKIVRAGSGENGESQHFFQTLAADGQKWEYGMGGLMTARATEDPLALAGAWNLCDLGLSPTMYGTALRVRGASWNPSNTRCDGRTCVIVATRGDLRKEVTLDVTRDSVPIRAVLYRGEELVAESRTTESQLIDGVWYPKKVEFYTKTPGGERRDSITVEQAEFNKPEHPSRMTPAALGLEVGTNVQWTSSAGQYELRMWTGEDAVPVEEFTRMERSGQITYSDRARKYMNDHRGTPQQILKAAVPISRSFETEWARYTREFCDRYSLNEEQRQAADRILKDCEEQARRYLDSHKSEIDDLLERWEKAKTATSAPAEIVNTLLGEGVELKRPIQRIFDERLKPRLETLPTKAQRAAVDRPAASQPK